MIESRSPASAATVATWRPLYWEPVAGTGERIMIGVVHGLAGRWGATRVVRDDVLDCLFGKSACAVRALLEQGLKTFEVAASAVESLEQLSAPLMGLHPGPLRETEAASVSDVLHTATLLYGSLGKLDVFDELETEDAPLPEEVNRRFSTDVRESVVRRRPDLARGFGQGGTLIEGGQRVKFGYFSPKAVLHFTVLHPVRQSASVRDARARLFELQRARDIAGIGRAALIAAVPADDEPTLGVKQRELLRANQVEIEREADAVNMRWFGVRSAIEGADRVIEIAG